MVRRRRGSHFPRARFRLDDGRTIRAGAFTMNVGHHRDGAECETAACQWDDTRTVAGIVTVGTSWGMWFSAAAASWLAESDRRVFQACQPSPHMRQGPGGQWQLRAALSVPVPGHRVRTTPRRLADTGHHQPGQPHRPVRIRRRRAGQPRSPRRPR